MGRGRKRRGRPVDGILLLDKPAGMTSNQALQRTKRLLDAAKGGHTGALDPAATGMLPLCFGEATKVCSYLLDADKVYRVSARLGTRTDTGDADGTVIESADVPELDAEAWTGVLQRFLGETRQVPPMYSALKKDGRRLYELARRGETVDRAPRTIRIREIELLELAGQRLVFRVRCSKGTYIRSLVEDIAAAVGTVAHTAYLRREAVGPFEGQPMLELDAVEALAGDGEALLERLLPADRALAELPAAGVAEADAGRFRRGQAVRALEDGASGLARVYVATGEFLGIAERVPEGLLAPRKVFAAAEKKP